MLALAVLVLQSVVTSAVYAVNEAGEGTVPEAAVETVASDPVSDEGNDNDVVTDLTNSEVTTPVVETDAPVVEPEEIITETPAVEEPEVTEEIEDVDFYLPKFDLLRSSISPILAKALNTENPKWECSSESTGTCIKDPVHIVGSLDNPWDVQITKVVETTEVDWKYKITIEVKWKPVEITKTTPVCTEVVFDRSWSMGNEKEGNSCPSWKKCVCGDWYYDLFWWFHCTKYYWIEKWDKRNAAVAWAKLFASKLNELNNGWNEIAKIWLVTFAGDGEKGKKTDATEVRSLEFEDLSDIDFWDPYGWTNLDAWLLLAQEKLKDPFCNAENSKKYIVVITEWAPTFYVGWWNGQETISNIRSVASKTEETATEIKGDWIEIFTIGYQLKTVNGFDTADYLENSIASKPDNAYEWEDANKVAEAFVDISNTIHSLYANGTLIDYIWDVILVDGDQEPNKKEIPEINENWELLEFYVKIQDLAEDGDYNTNSWVYLTYTWYDSEWNPIPWQLLSIGDSSQIHWVQPLCNWEEPDSKLKWDGKYLQVWEWEELVPALTNNPDAEWKYVETIPDEWLEACTWTCDTDAWYVRDGNSCKMNTFTITYTDGVDGEDVFTDKVFPGVLAGAETPKFGENPTRTGYIFAGWDPEVKKLVDGTQTYKATWKDDKNNNGTPDDEEYRTITYTDGVENAVVFEDQVYGNQLDGLATPAYVGSLEKIRTDYVFAGWDPEVKKLVDGTQTYAATWKDDKNNNGIDDSIELVAIRFKAGDHGKIWDGTWYTTDKNLLPWYDKFPAAPNTTADNGWVFNGWSPSYKAGDVIPLSGAELVYTAQRKQRSGWWWGSSSSSYSCKNLPLHAIENNKDKPTKDTDYTYSQNTWAVCTFQCISGYTRNADKKQCVKSGGGNWWWDEVIELGWQVSDKCSVEWSNYSEEEKAAYLYACENDITTIRDIEDARLGDFLTRAEMAKMISVFATKELWMKPNTSKDCSNFAESIASYNQEMKDFMVMSCQLEIMWIHTTNYEPIPDFMPSKRVSRAEFGTVLSRILWWNKYEGTNSNYYVNHLNALKESNIITNINPHITEYRAWVFLMLYRSVEAIKLSKDTTNETVEEQVDEELQEEWKAQTWLVTEYDSWSVVPEMATETASWTLATGTVAEVGAWSTVESKTGDTVTTTWDIAKDEAKVETESTTWSTN